MLPDLPAEVEQGGVHIRHAGEVPGLGGLGQKVHQRLLGAGEHPVAGAKFLPHPLYPGPVSIGLEGAGLKILFVVGVVKGVGLQGRQALTLILPCRHGGDDGGIQTSGEEGAQRHVADQLAADGTHQQFPEMLHCVLVGLPMGEGEKVIPPDQHCPLR